MEIDQFVPLHNYFFLNVHYNQIMQMKNKMHTIHLITIKK